MDIDPSNAFAMFVNDRDEHRGIGIIEPNDKVRVSEEQKGRGRVARNEATKRCKLHGKE